MILPEDGKSSSKCFCFKVMSKEVKNSKGSQFPHVLNRLKQLRYLTEIEICFRVLNFGKCAL